MAQVQDSLVPAMVTLESMLEKERAWEREREGFERERAGWERERELLKPVIPHTDHGDGAVGIFWDIGTSAGFVTQCFLRAARGQGNSRQGESVELTTSPVPPWSARSVIARSQRTAACRSRTMHRHSSR